MITKNIQSHRDAAVPRREFPRIVQKITHDLREPVAVSFEPDFPARQVDEDEKLALLQLQTMSSDNFAHDSREIAALL
jgi:hypothetical protein